MEALLHVEEVAQVESRIRMELVRDIDHGHGGEVFVLRMSPDGLPVAVAGPLTLAEWSSDGGISPRPDWYFVPWHFDTERARWAESVVFLHLDDRTIESRQSTRDYGTTNLLAESV